MYGENDSAVVESCIASELGSGVVLLGLCDNVVDELSPHARLFFCGVVSCLERFACDLRLCTWGLARLTRGLARFLTADDKRKKCLSPFFAVSEKRCLSSRVRSEAM